MHDLDTPP